ncbi:hypothetical protein F5B19DRAFT_504380 [Rostrohypoxylon terebratum]|nr:hypothetical protein F5B19DRAFT_504380 [Rostrohypoxylon terebratum]
MATTPIPATIPATSTTYPVLTTTFTPAPECTELTISTCHGTDQCFGVALTNYHCSSPVHRCYPQSSNYQDVDFTYIKPYATYSPANACPMGWSTAASALDPDGVWCCPMGFGFNRNLQYCEGELTEGVAVSISANCDILSTIPFGPSLTNLMTVASMGGVGSHIVPVSELTITASAMGVFLLGQTSGGGPSQPSITSMPPMPPMPPPPEAMAMTARVAVVASVGSTVALLLFLSLGFCLIRRYRKRRGIGESKAVDDQGPPVPFLGDTKDCKGLDKSPTRPEPQIATKSEWEHQKVFPQELETVEVRYELPG